MGKAVTSFALFWLVMMFVAAGIAGSSPVVSTRLTSALAAGATTINVASTTGFPSAGVLVIGLEKIGYAKKTATTFIGTAGQPLVRGMSDTTDTTHAVGFAVRTLAGSTLNSSMDYNVALISDSAGLMAFITVPLAIFNILKNFFTMPLSFIGTDLAFITYIWIAAGLGLVVSIAISMAGGRRV